MDALVAPARQARAHHRHDLRALTYVVLDDANGGIVRNVNHQGAAVQAVAALRPQQIVRLRFELRHPRLRVEARAQVVWSSPAGQCGVRFLDLPPQTVRQMNEWIFANLLDSIPRHSARGKSMFGEPMLASVAQIAERTSERITEDDGLIVSPTPRKVIELQPPSLQSDALSARAAAELYPETSMELDWLSQPLSGRSLAWTVDSLIVIAAVLVFALVFLSIAHELPRWPLSVEIAIAGAIVVALFYWGFFRFFAGSSMGSRLARLSGSDGDEDGEARNTARFR
jgi:hypothetical protein